MSERRTASIGRCTNCNRAYDERGTRCPACARHWSRYHTERPSWMWGNSVRVVQPDAVCVDLDAIPDDDSPRVSMARRMVHAALLQGAL